MTTQVTIWWAGLMRGAVSMALAYNQVKKKEKFSKHEAQGWGGEGFKLGEALIDSCTSHFMPLDICFA